MADTKISALSAVTTLDNADVFPVVASGVTKKITKANLETVLGVGEVTGAFAAREEQTSGTAGGTFTAGSWIDRTINTLEQDAASITLSSNRLTLPAGKWLLRWAAPAYNVNTHQSRIIINDAGSPEYHYGRSSISSSSLAVQMDSQGVALVDQSSSFTVKVQHRCQITEATNGLGVAHGWGDEVYSEIWGVRIGAAS